MASRCSGGETGRSWRGLSAIPLLLAACGGDPAPAPAKPPAAHAPAAAAPLSSHDRMVALLAEIRDRTKEENEYQGEFKVRELRAQLAALPPDAPLRARWELLVHLGEGDVLCGEERRGIALLEEARALLPRAGKDLPPEWPMELTLRLGSAWMRLAETENCCANRSPEACLLPLAGGGIHVKPEGARRALEYFHEVLAKTPGDAVVHLKARWLAALAAQALGEYPAAVAEEHRLPPGTFQSAADFPRFPNVAARAGLDTFGLSGGVAVEDYDGDGDLDLVVSTMETSRSLRYWRNEGDGTFSDRTKEARFEGILGGLNLVQGDVDNDGDTDLVVLRGAWFGKAGLHPNSLLRNRGDGVFDDVTFDAGLGGSRVPSQTAAFADVDNDGDLDLFVGNETANGVEAPCELFRNRGNGTFEEVGGTAGVRNGGFTKGAAFGDFDGDGWMDLYVSNLGRPNRLYRNRGDGTFEDVAPRRGVTEPVASFPCWFFDYDQDGVLDLFVGGYPAGPADAAAFAAGLPFKGERPRLYRGDGRGNFEERGREAGLLKPASPMGCNFGDFDDDGFPDFLLGTGNTTMWDLIPNLAYRNDGRGGFRDVTIPGGFGNLQKGHAVAFADFDADGDEDVFIEIGGAFPGDRFRDALHENPGFGNRSVDLRFVGTKANRSAIGARFRAEIVDGGVLRTLHGQVSSGGSFGANPLRQHLGVGRAERIETLTVTWPGSRTVQVWKEVPVDGEVTLVEGRSGFTRRERNPVKLGGGPR